MGEICVTNTNLTSSIRTNAVSRLTNGKSESPSLDGTQCLSSGEMCRYAGTQPALGFLTSIDSEYRSTFAATLAYPASQWEVRLP